MRMPKVRRHGVPRAVLDHLGARALEREIGADQLALLAQWLSGEPEVPVGPWFKRFPGMIACGGGGTGGNFRAAWANARGGGSALSKSGGVLI